MGPGRTCRQTENRRTQRPAWGFLQVGKKFQFSIASVHIWGKNQPLQLFTALSFTPLSAVWKESPTVSSKSSLRLSKVWPHFS